MDSIFWRAAVRAGDWQMIQQLIMQSFMIPKEILGSGSHSTYYQEKLLHDQFLRKIK
jgi:hypothetical protein